MAKRIVAKTGEYTNQQNEKKGEYTKLGVILNNDNGEYMLLDPSVSLSGVLIKQNALAAKTGGQQRDMLMVSIFEDDNQQQGTQQQAPQQAQGGFNNQQPQAQQGFNGQQQAPQNTGNVSGFNQAPPQQQGGYQQQPGK